MSKDFFLRKYDRLFGDCTSKKFFKEIKDINSSKFIRVNLSKTSKKDIEIFFKNNRINFEKTFISNCYKIKKSPFSLSSSLLNLTGEIYIQDLASQIPVNLIEFDKLKKLKRKISILDLCSSPGSKTTQICDFFDYKKIDYEMVCVERDKKRILRLINNIQKQNFSKLKVLNLDILDLNIKEKFDIVLLDAPCSGNFLDDKSWFSKRSQTDILEKSKNQKKLLEKSKTFMEKNGILIYSTCSLEVEENEENVIFAKENLKLVDKKTNFKIPFNTKNLFVNEFRKYNNLNSIRINPNYSRTQGFFVCVFENKFKS